MNVISSSSPRGVVTRLENFSHCLSFHSIYMRIRRTWSNQKLFHNEFLNWIKAKQIVWDNCDQQKLKPLSTSTHTHNMSFNGDINFNNCHSFFFLLILYKHIPDIETWKSSLIETASCRHFYSFWVISLQHFVELHPHAWVMQAIILCSPRSFHNNDGALNFISRRIVIYCQVVSIRHSFRHQL